MHFLFMLENAESLIVASKDTGLEVNTDKTKYMVMSRDQNAGGSDSIKFDNSSSERVDEFRLLGNNLKKSKFSSGRNS